LPLGSEFLGSVAGVAECKKVTFSRRRSALF
jgi:hypothetical protein